MLVVWNTTARSQIEPIDTSYYNDSSIQRIRYGGDWFYTGHRLDAYYDLNYNKQHERKQIFDTIYGINKFSVLMTREYLNNGAIIEKSYSYDKNKRLVFPIQGISVRFTGLDLIDVSLVIEEDSLISHFLISVIDTVKFRVKETLLQMSYSGGTRFNRVDVIDLGKYGDLKLDFFDNYFIKRIVYSYQLDGTRISNYLEFYNLNKIKLVGKYLNGAKDEMWYEYHKNGQIKSFGEYYPEYEVINVTEYNFFRDKGWKYYSSIGKLLKEEIYDKGKLIDTKTY